MRIDVHAHYFPTEYLDKLDEFGSDFTAVARGLRAGDDPGDIDDRLRMMDAAGVDMQVLSTTPQLPTFDDADRAVEAARLANDLYADLVRRHPDRFAGFATTPLPHGEAAAAEVARAMDELGMIGASIGTAVLDRTLADPEFEPLWAELNRRKAPLFIHASGRDADSPLISEHGLTWIVGAPFEDAIGVLHFVRAGITARYPDIKVIVAHLGGPIPFLAQRIDDNYAHWGQGFPELPSDIWKKMWWDTANFHAPSLRCSIDTFGADRIVLGSDFPYFQDDLYTRAVSYVEKSDLADDTVHGILDGNAVDLLGLGDS
ncbi:amidohydrolase family protein [Nocardioides sp. L-11A]|uniref:amidohydrolase family protein n=1 Tax=Nocardioides sp. L-11A TaxID=3043848 RepID=UPI00249A9E2C|nr:amidohydrolase family protein [Nocardioides sp. L-11A]